MEQREHYYNALQSLGFTYGECERLRLASMTLHSWHERECGTDNGCIERDEVTGKAYWLNAHSGKRYRIADRETGALKRISETLKTHNGLSYYVQTDPRGAALYILRPGDVPEGQTPDSCYTRGICVF
jgi:hypothetical protein